MNRSDDISKIVPAFLKVLAEVRNPPFDSKNPHFKNDYASLDSVRETLLPHLTKNQLGVTQLLGSRDGLVTCETVLLHESTQWLSAEFALPSQPTAQGYGSAATYARRYALMAFFGIVGEKDDDGAAASPEQKRQSSKRQTPKEEQQECDEKPSTGLLFGRGRKYKQWDGQQVAKWVKEEFGCYINSLTPDQMADACRRLKEDA